MAPRINEIKTFYWALVTVIKQWDNIDWKSIQTRYHSSQYEFLLSASFKNPNSEVLTYYIENE